MSGFTFDRHKALIALIAAGMVAGIGLVTSVDALASMLKGLIAAAVVVNPGNVVEIRSWLPYAIIVVAGLGAFFVVIGIGSTLFAIRSLRSGKHDKGMQRSRELNRGLLAALREIVEKLYSAENYPEYVFDEIEYVMEFDQDGTGVVSRREQMRANSRPIPFWTQGIFADPEADAVEEFGDLAFVATQSTGKGKIVPVPITDEPRTKRIALFCLPSIDAAEPDARAIATTFKWPGLGKKLLLAREMDWAWTVKPVNKFEAAFYFHPTLTPIDCDTIGLVPAGGRLERATNAKGWPGWKYSCDNAKADRFKYAFQFRRPTA